MLWGATLEAVWLAVWLRGSWGTVSVEPTCNLIYVDQMGSQRVGILQDEGRIRGLKRIRNENIHITLRDIQSEEA